LTLVILAGLPVFGFIIAIISSKSQPRLKAQIDKLAVLAKHASSAFSSIETVKCFSGHDTEYRRYYTTLRDSARGFFSCIYINCLQTSVTRFATLSMFVQGFWMGSHLVDSGSKVTDIMTAIMAAIMANATLMQVMPQLITLDRGRAAGHTLRGILGQEEKQPSSSQQGVQPVHCTGDIQLHMVSVMLAKCSPFLI
jgi:ATP-binding cassette, subfamily B (MDR/TAP), member 1